MIDGALNRKRDEKELNFWGCAAPLAIKALEEDFKNKNAVRRNFGRSIG
jgi:hypothetical protein